MEREKIYLPHGDREIKVCDIMYDKDLYVKTVNNISLELGADSEIFRKGYMLSSGGFSLIGKRVCLYEKGYHYVVSRNMYGKSKTKRFSDSYQAFWNEDEMIQFLLKNRYSSNIPVTVWERQWDGRRYPIRKYINISYGFCFHELADYIEYHPERLKEDKILEALDKYVRLFTVMDDTEELIDEVRIAKEYDSFREYTSEILREKKKIAQENSKVLSLKRMK